MRILLTNDDGIHAEGLAALERIARTLSDDVWVVAPEADQSGYAHSLSISNPIRLRRIGEKHYAVNGTPTDCVIMGAKKIMPSPPDLVLSGVNSGANLADDVTYSGTVAGAMEGALLGIRSIALSQAYWYENEDRIVPYATCEALAPAILDRLISAELPTNILFNVNFPNCRPEEVRGTEITAQGKLAYGMWVEERRDGRGLPYHWLRFGREPAETAEGSDLHALKNRFVSVTPLKLDLTAHETRDYLTGLFA